MVEESNRILRSGAQAAAGQPEANKKLFQGEGNGRLTDLYLTAYENKENNKLQKAYLVIR